MNGSSGIGGPSWTSIGSRQQTQVLSQEAQKVISDAFQFKAGIKVVQVEKGIKTPVLTTLNTISGNAVVQLQAELGKATGLAVDAALVILGGAEMVRQKNVKKLNRKDIKKFASLLGIPEDEDVLIVIQDHTESAEGGFIFIRAGLEEIENSYKE